MQFFVGEQNILWFDVAMNNVAFMLVMVSKKKNMKGSGVGHTKYLTPWNSCTNTFLDSASVNFCFITIQLNSSPSVANSRTR